MIPATPLVIAGPGRVGLSLLLALRRAGCGPLTLLARDPAAVGPLPQGPGLPVVVADLSEWTPGTGPQILFITVRDEAIAPVARRLSDHFPVAAAGWIAFHTSGALDHRPLEPLHGRGLAVGSWHPLQTFTTPDPDLFRDIPVAMEGDPPAVAAGTRIARMLGARPVAVPAGLKPLYHCLATTSCAHVAALLLFCREALAEFPESERESIWRGLLALAGRTAAQLNVPDPARVVTGPAARGDRRIIELHRRELAERFPHWLPVYSALTDYLDRLFRPGRTNG